jgi:RNA polymerase sigma factor (sigma-70 family)
MTDPTKGPPPRRPFAEGEQERVPYAQMGDVVEYVIKRIFGIKGEDAGSLALAVLIEYQDIKHPLPDVNAWLIAGSCAIAKRYLERRGLPTGDEAEKKRAAERWVLEKEALPLLPERYRAVWRLRFEKGKTNAEIAAVLGVTLRSAKRIVNRAGSKLRALVKAMEGRPPTASEP